MYRKKLSLLHWRRVGGEIWRQIFNLLSQFDRLVLPLLGRTPGIRSVPQSPNVSWGHAFVSMPHPCCWFACNTFHHIPIYKILQPALDSKPALPVCPSVPETLNLWGQSRSQVRSSGTGLHSVSARQSEKRIFFWSGVHSWWSSSRRCPFYYHEKIVRHYNVTLTSTVCPRRDRDALSWTRGWPPLLLQRRQSQGAHPIGWLCFIALTRAQSEDSQGSRPRLVYQLQQSHEFTALVFLYQ